MKQVLRFLALAALICVPWVTQGQTTTLTVNDGTANSSNVPIYGLYADTYGAASECVIPADDITVMAHGTIEGLTFYVHTAAAEAWTGTFQVYVGEMDGTTLSTISGPTANTVVYTGPLDATGTEVSITFDDPYVYNGGDLVIGTYVSAAGNWKSAKFYGVSTTENTARYRTSSSGNGSATQFLPKTTFTYTPGSGPTCEKPATFEVSNVSATGATLTWTGGSGTYNVEYKTAAAADWTPLLTGTTATTHNMTSLTSATDYQVRVQSVCGGEPSGWKTANFSTLFGIPFTENFGTSLPTGWDTRAGLLNEAAGTATLTSSSNWSFGDGNSVFDNHARCNIFSNYQKWLILPAISMVDNVQLTFDLALTKYNGSDSPTPGNQADDKFIVLASTDNMETWTVLRKWDNAGSAYVYDEITNSATGQAVAINLSAYDGQSVIIAFYGESTVSGGDNNIHIDNVSINYIPSCPKPTDLTLGAITATEAPLTWTAGGSEESWKVYLNGALVATVNTNSYTFTGLTASTDYTFGVAAVCGVDDESTIATVAGHTPCGTYAIPYSYGFEDLSDMTCWTVIDVPAHTTIDDGSTITGASARTGNNFFVFTYYDYPDVNPQYMTLISPELTGIANGLHVEFYYLTDGSTSYPESFRVGYSTTDNNLSSFTWVNTLTNVVAADYQLFKANYPANTKYVAVQHLSDDMNYLILDDFSFTEAPSCTEPSNLQVSNITTSGAALSWTIGGEATAWDIYVTDDDTDVPDDETTPTYAGVTSNTNCPISGLTSGTTYYVYVRSACDATTHSDWTMPTSFNTACEAISLPYQYDFEDDVLPVCWNTIGTNSGWITSFVSSTAPQHGSKHFVIQTSNNATGTQYVVLPEVDANYPLNEYEITFYSELAGSTTTGRTLAVGVMTDPTDASTFVQVGDAFTPTTSYERYKIRLNTYTGSGQYIAIKQVITSASYYADYTYIDNLEVNHIPSCFEPTAFANTAVTAHGATFSWTAGNSETEWQLYVSTSASDPADDIADNASGMYAVTTNPYTIASGLDAETDYYAWVRANCGNTDGYSTWVGPEAFQTTIACPAPTALAASEVTNHTAKLSWTGTSESYNVKYRTAADVDQVLTNEGFEGGSMPDGWTHIGEGTAAVTSPSSTHIHGGSYVLKFSGTTDYNLVVLPSFGVETNLLAIDFWSKAEGSSSGTFEYGYVTDATDASTFNKLGDFSASTSTSYQHVENCSMTSAPDGARIAFRHKSGSASWFWFIDDVKVVTLTTPGAWVERTTDASPYQLTNLAASTKYEAKVQGDCGTEGLSAETASIPFTTDIPCPAPSGLTATNPKSNSIDLSWTNGGSEDWVVAYKAASETDFSEVDVNIADVTVGANNISYTLTGLHAETDYIVKVLDNCEASYAGDGVSEWTAEVPFSTIAACSAMDPVVSNVTHHNATVNWDGESADGFTVNYRQAAHIDGISEEFNTSNVPEGWTRYTGLLSDVMGGTATLSTTTSGWNFSNTNVFGAYHTKLNIYGTSCKYWLVTPKVNLANGSTLQFDLALTDYNSEAGLDVPTGQADDKFVVLITTDNMENWSILREWNNNGSEYIYNNIPNTADNHITIDLSAYTGDVKIAFYGESTVSASNEDNDLHIDNVTIGANVPAGDWQTKAATTTTADLTGLTAGTKYDLKVVPNCDETLESSTVQFTTLPANNKYFLTAGDWNTASNWMDEEMPTITDNAIIRANATIPNGTVATAKKITFEGSPLPTLTLADGGQLISNNSANIIVQKNAAANRWMGISTPSVTSYGSTNIKDGTYDLLQYNENTSTWASQKSAYIYSMTIGRGYIYRRANAATLTFTGATNVGDKGSYAISYAAADAGLKGFNLIGNPYPHNIYYGAAIPTDHLAVGFYTLQPDGTWQATSASTPILVGQAILVKASEAISPFTMTDIATAPGAKAAPAATLAFTVSNDEYSDVAYAMFSNGEGLPKISHLNPEAPMLSIDGYAIANLNEGIESFPMSFSGQGSYTLTVSGNTDVTGYLHLVDRATGRDIDLLSTPSYSFTGSPVSDRFTVKLTPDAEEGSSTSRFAIFDGNSLIVNGEGTLEVYDVMGRRLMSAEVTGSEYRIPGSDLHTGVYVLRMNGNSQKIVIK